MNERAAQAQFDLPVDLPGVAPCLEPEGWRCVAAPPRTVFSILNQDLVNLSRKHAWSLPDLRDAPALLLGSDYSGETRDSQYMVYSFLVTNSAAWGEWEPLRLKVREQLLGDSRRMAFKRLSDERRWQALGPFLSAADRLGGLSFSVAINKKCGSLFAGDAPLDLGNPDFACFRKWKPAVIEKACVVVNFLGFLLGGLAADGQDVFWFTDEDSIGANDERVGELTRLFAWGASSHLGFSLGHCRCGTARCDNGTGQIEDLLAIPDLVAGAVAEQMKLRGNDPPGMPAAFWLRRGDYSAKTSAISWWFGRSQEALKRLFCVLDPGQDGRGGIVSWFHFHDRND